jgi:Tfp pilus assembly protein PilP
MRDLMVLLFVLAASAPLDASAQTAAGSAQGPAPAAARAQASPAATDTRGFDYNPQGRRDPFVSLIGRGTTADGAGVGRRAPGLAGLDTAEVSLKGTLQTPSGNVAMLEGTDGRTYVVRPGDKLRDGEVRAISQTALVIVQDVSDPLSRERQREVRKTIRQTEAN